MDARSWLSRAAVLVAGALPFYPAFVSAGPLAARAEAPYAVIDWINPLNPEYVRLDDERFLLTTYQGFRVWDAEKNLMSEARGWPLHTSLQVFWAPMGSGTVVAGGSHTGQDVPYGSLVWWKRQDGTFAHTLTLAPGSTVMALVPLDAAHVLACLRTGQSADNAPADAPLRARVVELRGERLAWSEAPSIDVLRQAGVRGPVEGSAEVGEDAASATPAPPVVFDTASCTWQARPRPPQLGDAKDLRIKHYRLPDGRIVIGQADGVELTAPLLWDAAGKRWTALEPYADKDMTTWDLAGDGVDDPLLASAYGFIEFFDPATLRWTRSQEDLPETYSPSLAALGPHAALAFLREHGHVLRMTPMRSPIPGRFGYRHGLDGEIAVSGGLLMLSGGSSAVPAGRAELVRAAGGPVPSATVVRIAQPPAPWKNASGIELPDHGVLVSGPGQPTYRYVPERDRWDDVAGLALPWVEPISAYAKLIGHWPATHVAVRRNGGLVFLDGAAEQGREQEDKSPLRTVLKGWSARAGTALLAPLPQGRSMATLLESSDGRIAVLGGREQARDGSIDETRAVALFDPRSRKWSKGPASLYPGGRAFKLDNGRILKLSVESPWSDALQYQAEALDPALRRWEKLPAFPLAKFEVAYAVVAGKRLLLQGKESHQTVVWDDQARTWQVWKDWSRIEPLAILPLDAGHALVRDYASYEIVRYPQP